MSPIDQRSLRTAFGSFMTGVTVVTTNGPDGTPLGFTANSFSSVSLDPPLLLVCPGKFLSSYEAFRTCNHFAISVLREGQEDVANTFASFKGDRFSRVNHRTDIHGIRVVDNAVAVFSCRTSQVIEAGDHCILLGEVSAFEHPGGYGLGYAGGRYFSLGMERATISARGSHEVAGVIIQSGENVLLESTPDGLRPFQIRLDGVVPIREALERAMAGRGIRARLGRAYSIFHEVRSGMRHCYLLATALDQETGGLEAIPLDFATEHKFSSQAIASMLARYALETRTRNFSLYIGDDESGDIHAHD